VRDRAQDFETIDHTADIGVIVHGRDLGETFANAARAMFSLITDLTNVDEATCREIQVSAEDIEGLLVAWLDELIYLFDVEGIIFKRFEVAAITATELTASSYGEKLNPLRHELKMGIKAATYHMLRVEEDDGFTARVIFDV
jgi:SHS2 domain-containing protein